MTGSIIIDSFPENAARYRDDYAIIVIDVIRSTTVATTALSLGRRVFPAASSDEAFVIASSLSDPLMAGELGGHMPYGFEMPNSPAQLFARTDVHRPMVLVSSSGTQLLRNATGGKSVYIASFQNLTAVARHVHGRHERIAILGAGTRGQFRREDQMGCAWVAERLLKAGYVAETDETAECVFRWMGVSPETIRGGQSAAYLRHSGQQEDLEFILSHIDDLNTVPSLVNGELVLSSDHVISPSLP